jgi:hypothetical protein
MMQTQLGWTLKYKSDGMMLSSSGTDGVEDVKEKSVKIRLWLI